MTLDAKSQKAEILRYCREHGSITIREAFVELGINSPSKRISELRQMGKVNAVSIEEKVLPDGTVKRWKRYFLDFSVEDKE